MLTGVLILGTLSAAFLTPSALCETPTNPDLSRKLKSALTRVEFVNELEDKDSVFDFGKVVGNPYNPGSVLNANAATFPMLTSSGMTVAQINLGPCAMLAHHLHPRAHNVVVSISGTTKTYMRTENGANDIVTTLTPGKVTMFYAGSIHEMHNEGCSNNLLYSFLNSDDPGTLNVAQAFWGAGQDPGQQVMPMVHTDDSKDWNDTGRDIPDWGLGAQVGSANCRRVCGVA